MNWNRKVQTSKAVMTQLCSSFNALSFASLLTKQTSMTMVQVELSNNHRFWFDLKDQPILRCLFSHIHRTSPRFNSLTFFTNIPKYIPYLYWMLKIQPHFWSILCWGCDIQYLFSCRDNHLYDILGFFNWWSCYLFGPWRFQLRQ